MSSNGNHIISLSIPSSLKLEEDLTHKGTVRIHRHNGCHVLGTVPGKVVLGPVIATIIVRVIEPNSCCISDPKDHFMILVTVARERVYGVKGRK